jgi:hypothetical protein
MARKHLTEAGWLRCQNPDVLLGHLADEPPPESDLDELTRHLSGRKLRLYGAACCRLIWHLMTDRRSHRAVAVMERFADGESTSRQFQAAGAGALAALFEAPQRGDTEAQKSAAGAAVATCHPDAAFAAGQAWVDSSAARRKDREAARERRSARGRQRALRPAAETALLRCLFGNPWRPLLPRAFPAHVIGLAQAIYASFPAVSADYAILADALEELGEAEAAAHCRTELHARGCHVLDWITGCS